jgi:hypothetical protein
MHQHELDRCVDVRDCCETMDGFEDWIWTFVNVDSRGSCSLTANYRGVVFFVVSPEVLVEQGMILAELLVPGRLVIMKYTNPPVIHSQILVDEPVKTLFRHLELSWIYHTVLNSSDELYRQSIMHR